MLLGFIMGSCLGKNDPLGKNDESLLKEIDARDEKFLEHINFETYDFRKAKVIDVYDGDTCTIVASHHGKLTKFRIRLMEINAPEVKGGTAESKEAGRLAKEFLTNLILNKVVDIIVVENRKFRRNGKDIEFLSLADNTTKRTHEPFGRLLSYIFVNGKSVSELMLQSGHAVLFQK